MLCMMANNSNSAVFCIGVMCVIVIIVLMAIRTTHALTGHVCRRMAEETYLEKSTRAFLCNERYTTSCGHLDWRRCTKYRVQTCYGPSERYAIRYREVEECCPGWQQSAGSCSIPICYGMCQNGGVCTQTGAVPHCSCLPGYYGDNCQHKRGTSPSSSSSQSSTSVISPAWIVVIVIIVVVVVIAGVLPIVYFIKKRLQLITSTTPHTRVSPSSSTSSTTATPSPTSSSSNTTSSTAHHGPSPLSTISGSIMSSRIVQPSAPSTSEKGDN